MSYRPSVKTDQGGATVDFPLDAETIRGKSVGFLTITNASGTLTSAQYSELTKDIALIKYGNKVFYKEDVDSSNKLVFVGKTNISVISNTYTRISQDIVTIDTTTRAYEYVANALINTYTNTQIDTKLSGKQDTISDLATIRSGASKGATSVQPSDLSTVATSGSYNDLSNKPTIPTALSQLSADSTHRLVTDTEKSTWNGKQNALTFDNTPTANSNNPVKSGGIKTYVDNAITDVVEIAEGKTKNYVISDVAISGYVNDSFNSTNDTIALTIGSNKVRDISGNDVALSSLKVGDIVSITETSVPDRWVGSITSTTITFYKMETKIDVVNAITQNDTRPITSGAVYTGLQNIDASKITSGTFDVARIPNLSATKITSGILPNARLSFYWDSTVTYSRGDLVYYSNNWWVLNADSNKGSAPSSISLVWQWLISGISHKLYSSLIPDLSASKITSGTFNVNRIPDLDASKITSGTINPARLDIEKNLNLWSIGIGITYVTSDWYTLGGTCNNGYQSVLPNTTYTLSISESHQMGIGFYNTNKAEISSSSYRSNTVTFTTPSNCYYIHINYVRNGVSISWAMLNKGSSALAYMPYIQNESPKIMGSNGFTTISGVSDLISALNSDIGKMVQFMLVDKSLTEDTVILFPSIVLPKYSLVSGYLSGTAYMSVAGGTIAMQGRLYYYELEFNISYNSNNEMSVNSVTIYRAYNNGDRAEVTNGLIGYYLIA